MMTKAGERLLKGMTEALSIAKGEQPAARIHIKGHAYVPEIDAPRGEMVTLRALRKQTGMTQEELAVLVGCHWITISRLENGRLTFSRRWADRLAPHLGKAVFGILAGTERPSEELLTAVTRILENGRVWHAAHAEATQLRYALQHYYKRER
jgi:DNA-binding XRE family transcriptional regulator